MTIRETIAQGSLTLKNAGIETSSLDSSLLLSFVLNISRTELIAKGADALSEQAYNSFLTLLQRRLNGECIAYIVEKKEFRGLEFIVNNSVLVPRPDTETLVEAAKEQTAKSREQRAIRVLDLCTGSGAVAIALKNEMPELEILAADISAEALEVAKLNAKRLLPKTSHIHFFPGDLYKAFSAAPCSLLPADIIISNPPYIPASEIASLPAEVQKEPRIALDGGETGLEIIRRIIEDTPNFLVRGGVLLMEADPRQMKKITKLLENNGFSDIIIYKDLSGLQRVIGGKFEE